MAYEPDPDYDASYDYRDLREGSGQRSTVWRTALIGLGVLVALVAVFFAYRSGQEPATGDAPPLITADTGPIKIAPAEPGGMDIPNQDKLILNKGASQPGQQTEQLLPPPEQPVLPSVEAPASVAPEVPAQTAALPPEAPAAVPATPVAPPAPAAPAEVAAEVNAYKAAAGHRVTTSPG